ncbi:MAG: kynureninase, partial [Aestuariivirga sp.]
MTSASLELAQTLDAKDDLAPIRALFECPDDTIYMDANSVGPMPKAVREKARGLLEDWVHLRRRGWSQRQWLEMPSLLGDCIAPLIGAAPGTVVMSDSTTLNQFKAVTHALALRPDRKVILTQNGNFPTDVHVLQGIAKASGGRVTLRFVDSEDEAIAAFDDGIAVAALSHVDYRSGERWDMAKVTAAAHR